MGKFAARFPAITEMGNGHANIISPAGRVAAYVHNSPASGQYPQDIADKLVTTIPAALSKCRSGYGDIIYILPGTTFTVADATMMDNLVAGTKIVGLGDGFGNTPQFDFSATASQWVLNKAGVVIENVVLVATAAVVAGLSITGTGTTLRRVGFQAAVSMNDFVSVGACAHAHVEECELLNTSAAVGVTWINLAGANSHTLIRGCWASGASEADGTGFIDVNGVSTGLRVLDNDLNNLRAAGTAGITFADVASTGLCAGNRIGVTNNGTAAAQGIVLAGTTNLAVKFDENYVTDEKGKSGVLAPAVVAT